MFLRSTLAVLFLAFGLFSPFAAKAFDLGLTGNTEQADLISFGVGAFDFSREENPVRATEFRLEHRWGDSLLPMMSENLTSFDKYLQIHPFAGIETTDKTQIYAFGGFVFDMFLTDNIFLSPNLAVGLYERGSGKRLGSFVEFRSTLEGGWKFDNGVRVTGYVSHISNAEICEHNPGAEMIGGYVHIPTELIFGTK